jgi:redox-sensing transcriptional repressor
MPESRSIPDIVIGRLPVYLRALNHLLDEGAAVTSSHELAHRLGMSSAQIRKDLSHFGEFGKQGLGYDVAFLARVLGQILHVDREWDMALIGAGDLGHAIVHYAGFGAPGFRVACVFDNNPQKIGHRLGEFEILSMETLPLRIPELDIHIGIVAVPAGGAQAVVDELVRAGIRAILNYAPITVTAPPEVRVQHIDPVIHLQRMTFYL